jgi:co-chaperonin GroES (HSP10)
MNDIEMFGDRILVELQFSTTAGSLITEKTTQDYVLVKAIGPAVENVEVGDLVIPDARDMIKVTIDGKEYYILPESDVHIRVKAPK